MKSFTNYLTTPCFHVKLRVPIYMPFSTFHNHNNISWPFSDINLMYQSLSFQPMNANLSEE